LDFATFPINMCLSAMLSITYFICIFSVILQSLALTKKQINKTTGLDTERNLANDVHVNRQSIFDRRHSQTKKTECEELSELKTMQAIKGFAGTAVLVKQLK